MVRPSEVERAIAEMAAKHGIDAELIRNSRGRRAVCHARWEAWEALAKPGVSVASIGRAWPCDHTSILYGIRRLRGDAPKRWNSRSLAS